ncbi:MAG: gluconokinase [Asticcacaulis sp.]
MGTSGSGKSTLGSRLATALNWSFVEGDELHPDANIRKMANGTALNDSDRWPWLGRIAAELGRPRGTGCIVSCSALKRSYRDFIRARSGVPVLFVYPRVDPAVLRDRLVLRQNHYMPVSLLDSQLSTLEPPEPDEAILELDGSLSLDAQADAVMARLRANPLAGSPQTLHAGARS